MLRVLLSLFVLVGFVNCSRPQRQATTDGASLAKLLYYAAPQNEFNVHEGEEYRFPRADAIELTSGSATTVALALLRDSKATPVGSAGLGMFDLGHIVFQNERGDAEFAIETVDAPDAMLRPMHSDAKSHWMPQTKDGHELRQLYAPEFYRVLLPNLRRADPIKVASVEHLLGRSLDQWFERD